MKMNDISIVSISDNEVSKLRQMIEGHFCDLKAIEITPAKLTRTISAFSNSEGGEVFIGIDEDKETSIRTWRGFEAPEGANGHIQTFEKFFPLSADYAYDFLSNENAPGLVLKLQVAKTREVKAASNGKVYVRRGAQNLPVESQDRLEALKRDKGLVSFETEPVNCHPSFVTNSEQIIMFMLDVVPTAEPEPWLIKQQVIVQNKPTVAGIVLFADEPQAILPKRCGIKLYRYKTSDDQGSRETLDFDPISIEGSAYSQVKEAVKTTAEIIESVRINTPQGLQSIKYPLTAIHEIVTNAVLHRDYSIADDIHIKIFDNRL